MKEWEPYELTNLKKNSSNLIFKRCISLTDLFSHPMLIVSLGGCSAAFVSTDGLIATNITALKALSNLTARKMKTF